MSVTQETIRTILHAAAEKVTSNSEHLNQLDSQGGDGDHGTAMSAATQAAHEAATTHVDGPWSDMLTGIGFKVMGAASGSTSSLVGSFYTGMADALRHLTVEPLDTDTFIGMFESALANLRSVSRANAGDKTMLDALIPAVATMTAMKGTGATVAEVMNKAAEAAQAGAEATKDMVAKAGRAKNIGERSLGNLDAGASSFAMMFRAFADALNK